MILYFSGTGNSKLVAHRLAALMQEKIYNLEQGAPPALHKGERLVLVAPLYFWTLPSIVLEYLAQHQQLNRHELHLVITCGGALGAGAEINGPAVIEEVTTTIVIEPGWSATLDASGSYLIARKEKK